MKKILFAALFVPLLALAQTYPSQPANTVLANPTNSTASPTAVSVPSCSTSANALGWTSGSGFTCNTGINAATLGGATFAAPGAIGSTAASTYAFTTGTHTSAVEMANFSPNQNIVMFPGQATDYSDNTITHTNAGSHGGTSNSAFSIASTVTGSSANGPLNADYGMYLSAIKSNFLNSATHGEMDGLSIVTRQGQDDTDGILLNVGGVAGYMGLLEGVTNQFQAATGTILKGMDIQIGEIETGSTGTAGSAGFVASAQTGALQYGLLIQSAAGASWATPINVYASGSIGTSVFTVAANGEIYSAVGIQGVTPGAAAPAGIQGQIVPASSFGTSLTPGQGANCASISLDPGDWLVWGSVSFNPQPSTTIAALYTGITTTSATWPGAPNGNGLVASFATGNGQQIAIAPAVENLTSTTTVYAVGEAVFGASTMTCNGYITAMRYH